LEGREYNIVFLESRVVVTYTYWYVVYDHNGTYLGIVATLHPSDKWWWRDWS